MLANKSYLIKKFLSAILFLPVSIYRLTVDFRHIHFDMHARTRYDQYSFRLVAGGRKLTVETGVSDRY